MLNLLVRLMTMMMIIIIIIIIITIIHLSLLSLHSLYVYFLLSLWLWQSNSALILIHHFNSNFDCNICCFSRTLELLSKPFKWYSLFFFYFVVSTCICSSFLPKLRLEVYLFTIYGPIWDHLSASIINDLKQKNSVLLSCGEITFGKTIGRCQQGSLF